MKTIEEVIMYALRGSPLGEVQLSLYEASHPAIKQMVKDKLIYYSHAQNASAKLLVTIKRNPDV